VVVLADAILEDLRNDMGKHALSLGERAQRRLATYPFHGNVRELRNVLERAAVMENGAELNLDLLDLGPVGAPVREADEFVVAGPPITLEDLQDRYVKHVLERMSGKRMEAAQALGISYPTLAKRLGSGPVKES
jgi:two-component system response regulator AtoC